MKTNGRTKKISVLVNTRDNQSHLRACLANLAEAEKQAVCDLEVIILDSSLDDSLAKVLEGRNGLTDLSWCPVEQWWNYSRIINYGAQQATGDYLFLLNGSCYVPTNIFTKTVLSSVMDKKVSACGFLLVSMDGRVQHSGYMLTKNPLSDTAPVVSIGSGVPRAWYTPPAEITPRAVSFDCVMIPKELFDKIGGLDPEFYFGMEDVDFCLRATTVLNLEVRLRTDAPCINESDASIELISNNFPLASPLKNAAVLRKKWGHLSGIGM